MLRPETNKREERTRTAPGEIREELMSNCKWEIAIIDAEPVKPVVSSQG